MSDERLRLVSIGSRPDGRAPRARSKARLVAAGLGHRALRRLGFDVVRVRNIDEFATRRLFALGDADVVVDVGANIGRYAELIRKAGYEGRIVSFEPLPAAFAELCRAASSDPLWLCQEVGLSDRIGVARLNVSRNLVSSSLLPLTAREAREAPETAATNHLDVQIATLDSLRNEWSASTDRIFLKLDVQGVEAQVLAGASQTLEQVVAIEAELSLIPLYEGQELISELVELLAGRSFRLVAIESEYRDLRTGELKQVNGLFVATRSIRHRY